MGEKEVALGSESGATWEGTRISAVEHQSSVASGSGSPALGREVGSLTSRRAPCQADYNSHKAARGPRQLGGARPGCRQGRDPCPEETPPGEPRAGGTGRPAS